jgi:hypothetical protein
VVGSAFDRIRARMEAQPWHKRLRRYLWVKWLFFRLDACQAHPFVFFDEHERPYVLAGRPWLYRLLVDRQADVRQSHD